MNSVNLTVNTPNNNNIIIIIIITGSVSVQGVSITWLFMKFCSG